MFRAKTAVMVVVVIAALILLISTVIYLLTVRQNWIVYPIGALLLMLIYHISVYKGEGPIWINIAEGVIFGTIIAAGLYYVFGS